jgi:hypothetical protein
MRRRLTLLATTCALALTAASPAVAGAPGTNFPEQPNGNVATACANVLTNAGNGATGAATVNESATASAIKFALASDACFGG